MLAAQIAISFSMITPIAIFIGVTAIVWVVVQLFSGGSDRIARRIEEFRDPLLRKRRESEGELSGAESMARMFEQAAPSLAKPLMPQNEKDSSKLKDKLSAAGFRGENAAMTFLSIKVIAMLIGLFAGGGWGLSYYGLTQSTLIRVLGLGGLGFYLPELVLGFLGSRRKNNIFYGLPDALDLMVVCVEAGLGLDQAMRKVSEEMKHSYRVISDEFGLCNLHLQMGRQRAQALQELGQRTGVDDLRSLASVLIQADKFGSSVAQALRVQSDAMRTRRKQMAEEKAAKTAVKLIFPLVIFIFPGIFVILVGPAAITMMRELFPLMGG
jgi:tight adherence protein C